MASPAKKRQTTESEEEADLMSPSHMLQNGMELFAAALAVD